MVDIHTGIGVTTAVQENPIGIPGACWATKAVCPNISNEVIVDIDLAISERTHMYSDAEGTPSTRSGVSNAIDPVTTYMNILTGGGTRGALRSESYGYPCVVVVCATAGIENGVSLYEKVFLCGDDNTGRSGTSTPAGSQSGVPNFAAYDPIIFIPAGVAKQNDPLLHPVDPAVFYGDVVVAGHIGGIWERALLTKIDAHAGLGFVSPIYFYITDGDAFAGIGVVAIVRNQANDTRSVRWRASSEAE
jgi:hypothetical protein